MDKQKLVSEIQSYLAHELNDLLKPGSAGDPERVAELERLLVMYKYLPVRDYSGAGEVVAPSALVGLKLQGRLAYYLMVPRGGGLVTRVDGEPVQVITPQSPLGEALLGKQVGEQARVKVQGQDRVYDVVSLA